MTRQSETTEQREYRRKKLVMPDIVETLLGRGVVIPCPAAVEIGADLDAERIASGVVVHAGCKILGAKTSIGPGCVLGAEAPTTVENCQLGAGVALKGGYHAGSVFLDEANMGSGAQVRPGTLLEEEANGAHTVGFKQTVFLSYVTAGSLINFCDALMAGGTSRKNHSEIGSSYIHFNYTPHGDKATASLIGDVPRGVMLDQSPIFLGGQGGLVGPVRIEYGCVIPAGVIRRKEGLEPAQLLSAAGERVGDRAYRMGVYHGIDRIVANNLIYIGNIRALRSWYAVARRATMDGDKFSLACHEGALKVLDDVLGERIKRLRQLAGKLPHSVERLAAGERSDRAAREIARQKALIGAWPRIEASLRQGPAEKVGAVARDAFLEEWEKVTSGCKHTEAVGSLSGAGRKAGTAWLQAIVDATAALGAVD